MKKFRQLVLLLFIGVMLALFMALTTIIWTVMGQGGNWSFFENKNVFKSVLLLFSLFLSSGIFASLLSFLMMVILRLTPLKKPWIFPVIYGISLYVTGLLGLKIFFILHPYYLFERLPLDLYFILFLSVISVFLLKSSRKVYHI